VLRIDEQSIDAHMNIPGSLSISLPQVSSARFSEVGSANCSGTVVFQYYGACYFLWYALGECAVIWGMYVCACCCQISELSTCNFSPIRYAALEAAL
jgi:hypothetical protein